MSEAAGPCVAQWLQAARRSGDWRLDPARFHAMEAMARRLQQQPPAVRARLAQKLQVAVAAYAARLAASAPSPPGPEAAAPPAAGAAPLARLNAHLRAASQAQAQRAPAAADEARDPQELASVRRFRHTWERERSIAQVEQAVARRPQAAGPLNSHALLLQSLDLMRELSPDYLRRFLLHLDALQWLAQAREKALATPGRKGKPAAPARRKRKA